MKTTLVTQQTGVDEQSLILPNKQEALLMKLNELKVNNLSAREQKDWQELTEKLTDLFVRLCWSKLGVSLEQLKKIEQDDLNELAAVVQQQSRLTAFVHTGILVCIPVIGWLILLFAEISPSERNNWKNLRYYWWYKRMKNKYHQHFEPNLDLVK